MLPAQIIHDRFDGKENFNRTWEEYKTGFGFNGGEYWLGKEMGGAKGGVWINCGEYWLGKDVRGAKGGFGLTVESIG